MTVCPGVGFTGRSSTATFLRGRLSTVATRWRTMFCGTRNCSTAWRPSTPASESCTTGSLSFSAGKAAAPAALSAAIGCAICGSVLTDGGAAGATTGVAAAGRGRDAYQYQPPRAITAATTIPMSHAILRRAALSTSSSHILRHLGLKGRVDHFTPLVRLRLCFNRSMPAAFHPAVARWFARTFEAPTPAQRAAWPAIAAQRHVLLAAPTGSGKTLAAFLAVIDELVRSGVAAGGPLPDETLVVYVSPLKALSNDIHRNLEAPLAGIRAQLRALALPDVDIRTFVRTGDTPQRERAASARRPPHIVVTTPESLYILLGSESGRRMLASTRTVIVDEIHAMVGGKRGVHLSLTLERLESLAGRKLTRVGLSATQKPVEEVARFLVGTRNLRADGAADCTIIDSGHVRERDLQLEIPASPLEAVMSGEVWTQIYDRLAQLVSEHRTTLVFVNTRRQAERIARHLSERLGEQHVTAHHGSMAKESRLAAESRLKRGELRALVATASLELGIDIGEVNLVCQLASPRSIAALLQRVGRSGHSVGGTPKGRLIPLSRDDLVECAALLAAVRRGELDRVAVPAKPLDVLSQQIVAEVAAREWDEAGLYDLLRGAYPCRDLERAEFDEVVRMLAEGYSTRRGRHGALVHHDGVNHRVKGRRGARLTALTSGGTIPDNADYEVMLEPPAQIIGTMIY